MLGFEKLWSYLPWFNLSTDTMTLLTKNAASTAYDTTFSQLHIVRNKSRLSPKRTPTFQRRQNVVCLPLPNRNLGTQIKWQTNIWRVVPTMSKYSQQRAFARLHELHVQTNKLAAKSAPSKSNSSFRRALRAPPQKFPIWHSFRETTGHRKRFFFAFVQAYTWKREKISSETSTELRVVTFCKSSYGISWSQMWSLWLSCITGPYWLSDWGCAPVQKGLSSSHKKIIIWSPKNKKKNKKIGGSHRPTSFDEGKERLRRRSKCAIGPS